MRISAYHVAGLVLLAIISPPVTASAAATNSRPYLGLVRAYADAMIGHGRDHYGSSPSPLFASTLDRKSSGLPATAPSAPEGIRAGDRTLSGGNPMHDENFYRTLYTLSDLTGERHYAQAADAALSFFFNHCQSEATGLLAWGEHLGWDFRTDSVIAGHNTHEYYRPWLLWNQSWKLAPESCRRFALGVWDNQINDHVTGNFSRHAGYAKHSPGRDFEFPRHAGFYIATWAEAYTRTKDTNFLHSIEIMMNSFERRRNPDGSFPSASAQPKIIYWASDLSWAIDVWAASAKVPEPLRTKMRKGTEKTDAAYLHEYDKGLPTTPAKLWAIGYGNATTAAEALTCHERWRQTHEVRYRRLVIQTAEAYLDSEPVPGAPLYPGVFGDIIALLVTAGEITGDARFLARADVLADKSVALFWNDGPLPRAATNLEHYEAITRADTLALALLQLWSAHTKPEKPLRLEWIDR